MAELVVHLDRSHAPRVPDASPFDAYAIAVAHFILVVAVELLAQKRGDVIGLDRMDGGPDQVPVDGLQVRLPVKYDVRGVFGFAQTPVIGFLDLLENGTVPLSKFVQLAVQAEWLPAIG